MRLELIGHKLCPFVQRVLIILLHKDIPHLVTYVDLDSPPDWLIHLAPLGKVPVLRVDNNITLFESAVINEYLDEVTPAALQPRDPLRRALNRCWIEYGAVCLADQRGMATARTRQEFEQRRDTLLGRLGRLEQIVGARP
jgi:glutathione S-transferase